ncbi:hypothetical protein [Nocardia brasiliensis]|uniref:hypothetical protein n=1 Tax=Nocardia brasiliensis TaxID=37326 RepID=UPI0024572ED5|nr:hypothetical protein [Nocardia brasiliensis]
MTYHHDEREHLHAELLELLRHIDFGGRYFQYYETLINRSRRDDHSISSDDFAKILAETGLPFRYFRREKFFGYIERRRGYDIFLHTIPRRSATEFALYLSTRPGVIGGPWSILSQQLLRGSHSEVEYFHESRNLPFSSDETLHQIAHFGVALFRQAREVICPYFDGLSDAADS